MQAKNNALATDIRMSIPETFAMHRSILDWQHKFSPDKIPAAAAGVSWPDGNFNALAVEKLGAG